MMEDSDDEGEGTSVDRRKTPEEAKRQRIKEMRRIEKAEKDLNDKMEATDSINRSDIAETALQELALKANDDEETASAVKLTGVHPKRRRREFEKGHEEQWNMSVAALMKSVQLGGSKQNEKLDGSPEGRLYPHDCDRRLPLVQILKASSRVIPFQFHQYEWNIYRGGVSSQKFDWIYVRRDDVVLYSSMKGLPQTMDPRHILKIMLLLPRAGKGLNLCVEEAIGRKRLRQGRYEEIGVALSGGRQ
ncbi:hypothetical protein Tco_1560777 [Tanacetum coccineum]